MSLARGPRTAELDWNPCHRLIPSRFPPVGLFDRVATPQELDVIYALQAVTHPRLRQEAGDISLVPAADRVTGPGSTPVMAAFCHVNPQGSRFSDGSYGVYYGAQTLETAVAEVAFHRAAFLAATNELPIDTDLRCYVARVVQPLHDLRPRTWAAVHAEADYGPSRALARTLRDKGSYGLVYRSVRAPGSQCVALLRPRALALPVVQGPHVTLQWDGQRISGWYTKAAGAALK